MEDVDFIPVNGLVEAIYGKVTDIDCIRAKLAREQVLSRRGWEPLYSSTTNSHQPSSSPLEEDKAFAGLATVFEQCKRAAGISDTACLVTLQVHSHQNIESSDTTKLDATIHLTQTRLPWARAKLDHSDIVLYMQLKEKDDPENFADNAVNLLLDVHQRFRSDPSCRFVCGVTIEGTTARFWHFSRAGMVSEPFDINKDTNPLINIFVSLARVDHLALGFDPTIECIGHEVSTASTRNYKIQVQDNKDEAQGPFNHKQSHTFTTRRIIANHLAAGIRTSGTWVFEGVEGEKPNGAPVVIKDIWIDSDREVEGTILEKVREALRATPEDLQFFLDPLCHGCVIIGGNKDITQPMLRSNTTTKFDYTVPSPSTSGTSRRDTSGGFSVGSLPKLPMGAPVIIGRRGDPRKHYRIVFKGKPGRALKDLGNCRDFFIGLLGGVKASRALLKAGYIHRDLSTGNVLLVKEGEEEGHGRVIDLEYAKLFPDPSEKSHDARTGTPAFIAVEVNARRFYFLPEDTEAFTSPPVPWFHNPIHDIESAWWIAVWAFCYLEHWVSDSLFTNDTLRLAMLFRPRTFYNECTGLPVALQKPLIQWITFMRDKYTELGRLVMDGTHSSFNYDEVFARAIGYIEEIIDALSETQDSALDTDERASKRRKLDDGEGNE